MGGVQSEGGRTPSGGVECGDVYLERGSMYVMNTNYSLAKRLNDIQNSVSPKFNGLHKQAASTTCTEVVIPSADTMTTIETLILSPIGSDPA